MKRFRDWLRVWLLGDLYHEIALSRGAAGQCFGALERQLHDLRRLLEAQETRVRDRIGGVCDRIADSERATVDELRNIREALQSFASFQEHEAVAFAVNKVLADEGFMKRASEDQKVEEAFTWAGHYLREKGWKTPGRERLSQLARARFQIG